MYLYGCVFVVRAWGDGKDNIVRSCMAKTNGKLQTSQTLETECFSIQNTEYLFFL